MAQIAALLLAIAKAVPAAAKLAEEFTNIYTAYKIQQNNAAQADKDRRNDAAVDAAGSRVPIPEASTPSDGAGQHSGDTGPLPVPGDGKGGT